MGARRWTVLVTGGAGYVGSVLVPKLLEAGHRVAVLDLFLYGRDVLDAVKGHPDLRLIEGDLRDPRAVEAALGGCDAVIHLACISNDPSFELDPELGKSINFDCFQPLVRASRNAGVRRFLYASSSSVYGIKEGVEVTEDLSLEPLTDYSRYKAACEAILLAERQPGFVVTVVRPATVCGYSPRQRLDVIVNILATHAYHARRIKVLGGDQRRPNLHIADMAEVYVGLLGAPDDRVDGEIFNAGDVNHTVRDLALMVQRIVGGDVAIETHPSTDLRSYHVSSDKIRRAIGFVPHWGIEAAVRDLLAAFEAGKLPGAMEDIRYHNVKLMQAIHFR